MSKNCLNCGAENIDEAKFCSSCGSAIYAVDNNEMWEQSQTTKAVHAEPEEEYRNIGGWLILLAIGIFFSPLMLMSQITQMYDNLAETIATISDVSSSAYNPGLALFIKIEKFINWSVVLLSIYLWILFFSKKRDFPIWFITISLFHIFFIIADAIIVSNLVPGMSAFDADMMGQLFKGILYAGIWIPYLLFSERAKKTFIN